MHEPWIGLEAISKHLSMSTRTIMRHIKHRGLPVFKLEGRGPWILLPEDALQWLREQKAKNRPEI